MSTDNGRKVTFQLQIAACWNNDLLFTEREFSSTEVKI